MECNFVPTPQPIITEAERTGFFGFARTITLRRVFVFAFILSLFCLAVRQSTIIDPDFWWHLKSGQYIFQSSSIPHTDPFSFTKHGSEWVAHEWLSEVVMYGIFRVAGMAGLLVLFGGTISAVFAICYSRSEGKPFVAGFTTLLAALASAPLFGLRPQMFTLLLASIFIWILASYRSTLDKRRLWLLPALMLLWVNLHGGYALGVALIGLFICMSALEKQWRTILPLVITAVISVAVVPINPNGIRLLTYPFETLSSPSMQTLIQEWASPDFHKLQFLPLAILLLAIFGTISVSPERPKIGELFGLVALSFVALRSGRHIPLFAIFAAPILAKHLSLLMESHEIRLGSIRPAAPTATQVALNLILILLPTFVAVRKIHDFSVNQVAYEAKRVPAAAVNVLQNQQLAGPIFNDYNWGGYLIWKLWPGRQVFVDGRADVYGDAFLYNYLNIYRGEPGWRESLNKFGIKTVLIEPRSSLASLMRNETGWRVAFEDQQAVIFTRN